MVSIFVAVAASYLLVATLGFVLGRIVGELVAREAASWPTVCDPDWPVGEPYDWPVGEPYDWAREGLLL